MKRFIWLAIISDLTLGCFSLVANTSAENKTAGEDGQSQTADKDANNAIN